MIVLCSYNTLVGVITVFSELIVCIHSLTFTLDFSTLTLMSCNDSMYCPSIIRDTFAYVTGGLYTCSRETEISGDTGDRKLETQVFQMYSNIAQFVQHQGHQGIEKTAKQGHDQITHISDKQQSDADIACQIKRLKWKSTHAVTETLRRRYKKHIVRLIQHAGEHTECT